MKPAQIKQHILALPLAQKRSLLQWLTQAIAEESEKALVPPAAPTAILNWVKYSNNNV